MGDLALTHRNKNFKQGYYRPEHPEKLLGKKDYVIYRSGLELSYFRILDKNPNVVRWGSEEIVIPYRYNDSWHKYYIDLVVFLKVGDELKKMLIELKPYKQTIQPVDSKRKKRSTFMNECLTWHKNCAKWDSAREYAKKARCEFKILTEKDLGVS